MSLPPILSDTPGSASRFKGVSKNGNKWHAEVRIPSEGGKVCLGTFDSEEEAGVMYARARYKYPVQEDRLTPSKQPRVSHRSKDSRMPMEGPDMSDTACMVCGLSSDPVTELILLCDGCDNEAHMACVGLAQVPTGDWFCASCHGNGRPEPEPGEIAEVDGIVIEAFSGPRTFTPSSLGRGESQSQSRPKKRSKTHR